MISRRLLPICHAFCGLAALIPGACVSFGESIDPRNPAELAQTEIENSRWPGARVSGLEAKREQLMEALAELPQLHRSSLQNRLGYHSAFDEGTFTEAVSDQFVNFVFPSPFKLRALGVVPAVDPSDPEGVAYAFPKRFAIEVKQESGEFSKIVDWTDEDFPDPGELPVVFSDFELETKHVRLRVPRATQSDGRSDFAIGEFFIWGGRETGMLVDNLMLWESTKVSASSNFSLPPMWDLAYLRDGVSGLGFPLHRKQEGRADLMILPEEKPGLEEQVRIVIDLGEPKKISRFDLWPGQARDGPALSGVGFPGDVKVDVSNDRDFSTLREIEPEGETVDRSQIGILYSVCVRPPEIRYVRMTLGDLQRLNGKRILGLGEIALYDLEGNIVSGKIDSVEGVAAEHRDQLPLLLDGYCWGRRIMPDLDWMKGLAQRRPLEQQLAMIEEELASERAVWQYLQIRLMVGGAILLSLVFVGVVVFQRLQRRWALMKMGDRISRDLHDEVGSSLGSISLLADELSGKGGDVAFEQDLGDLSLMAREANASLKEVVGGRDKLAAPLPYLVESFRDRAERVLRGIAVEERIAKDLPQVPVTLSVKRHLTMFFKEAVHNCARHAKASNVVLEVEVESGVFKLRIEDDGCGFDLNQRTRGWGLNNLKQRAEELRGTVLIESSPGNGTKIALEMPISALSEEIDLAYESSNQ